MSLRLFVALCSLSSLVAFAAPPAKKAPTAAAPKFMEAATKGRDLYALLETSEGNIVVRFFPKDAPNTVANFVGLATGEKAFTDPNTGAQVENKPFFDGVTCHRVIPNFMIQCGDPTGTGRGGPGYKFDDEVQSGRKFDKEGLLAMANAGKDPSGGGTNGSQFFITTSRPEYLNGKHTIFGEVTQGYDVAVKISAVPTGPGNKPNVPVVIKKVTISEKEPKAAAKK